MARLDTREKKENKRVLKRRARAAKPYERKQGVGETREHPQGTEKNSNFRLIGIWALGNLIELTDSCGETKSRDTKNSTTSRGNTRSTTAAGTINVYATPREQLQTMRLYFAREHMWSSIHIFTHIHRYTDHLNFRGPHRALNQRGQTNAYSHGTSFSLLYAYHFVSLFLLGLFQLFFYRTLLLRLSLSSHRFFFICSCRNLIFTLAVHEYVIKPIAAFAAQSSFHFLPTCSFHPEKLFLIVTFSRIKQNFRKISLNNASYRPKPNVEIQSTLSC